MDSEGEMNYVSASITRTSRVLLRLLTSAWRSGAFRGKVVLQEWMPRLFHRRSVQASHQLMLESVARRCTARGDSQLAVDRAHMCVHRQQTDDKLFSDLGTGQSPC